MLIIKIIATIGSERNVCNEAVSLKSKHIKSHSDFFLIILSVQIVVSVVE